MRFRKAEGLLALITSASVLAALLRWQASGVSASRLELPMRADSSSMVNDADISQLGQDMAERDPFRLSNQPSRVRHGEAPVPNSSAMTSYRPPLTLAAIVGGPPWTALIGGVPGISGVVLVRPGDVVDSVRVSSIMPGRVVIRGPDTTWVLTLDGGKP